MLDCKPVRRFVYTVYNSKNFNDASFWLAVNCIVPLWYPSWVIISFMVALKLYKKK